MIPRTTRRTLAVAILTFALATVAQASWYDDYDAGLAAIKSGNWNVAVQKMSAAIKGNPKEGTRVRTYGTIMISYHPYYYRGAAYLNSGRYEEAIADFERTSGQASDLGSLDALMGRAKKALAANNEPEPAPAPVQTRPEPVRPAVTQPPPVQQAPVVPQVDPALRQRAGAALAAAKQKIQQAQQRRASTSPQYTQAMSIYTDAVTRNAGARNNEELNSIITMADNAGDLADLAAAPSAAAPAPAIATTTPSPLVPKPTAAARNVMDEYSDELRGALELYFAGEFEDAAERFQDLTTKMPNNGWIHAFLGASQYSRYAFEADESYRKAAMDAFRKAKQLRSWKDGLPSRYFSKRIRQAFSETL
jgi:tetratricopeptide (TPR) repeat protein